MEPLSLVIPAYNEALRLPGLLDSVEAAKRSLDGGVEAIDVVLSDNGSTDGTVELALERGCRVARVEKRAIGAVRNGGAAIARGRLLAFVDADARIHADSFNAISRALASGRYVAGSTGITFDRWSAGLATTYLLLSAGAIVSGLDGGMVFCRKEDFEQVGGYDENKLYLEDVQFLWALKKLGESREQKLVRLRGVKTVVSTRKFDRYGDWHYLRNGLRSGFWALRGRTDSIERFAWDYWYRDRSDEP